MILDADNGLEKESFSTASSVDVVADDEIHGRVDAWQLYQ
jgi:hypothetical protein